MFCKKLMVSLISMTAVCGMGVAAPSVRATTSPNTVDTAARAGTLRVPTTKSATISSDTTSVRNNDAADAGSRMAYVSGTVGGKLSTRLQQPAPASASALSELERKVRELTDLNAEELNTLRSELGGKLDAEDFAEHFDTRATEKDLVDSSTVSSDYATKAELSSVPTSLAFSELTGRVDDAAADIVTLNTELGRKLDKDTADSSYASIAALQGVKNTADAAVTQTMLSNQLADYAKVDDLENIPSSEAFTSLTGRVGTAEGKITTLQSDLAGKANAGDSYTKSESDAQLQAAKDYADSQISNIEIPNPDLTNYYSKDETYNKTEVSNAIATAKAGATADAKTYADDTFATKSALSDKASASDVNSLTGRVDDATADIQTLSTELDRKLDKDTADSSYASIAALQGVKNTADAAVTQTMLSNQLADYAKVDDLENIPSSEAFTSLTGRVGTAEGKITTLQSDLAGKANAGDSYTKSESDAQLQAAKDYADSQISNIEIPNPDLTNYYSKDETYNKTEVSNAIATAKAGATADAKTYADDTFATKSALSDKASASDVNSLTGRVGAAEQIITALQTGKANVGDVYTKAEVDDAINNAAIDGQVDLSGYYKKTETYDQAQIDSAIAAAKTGATADAKTYADDTFALKSALNNYDTSAQTDAKIQAATTGLASETYASQQAAGALSSAQAYTNEKFNSIEIPEVDLSNYYTKDKTYTQAQIDSAIATAKTNAMDYADDTFALKSAVDAKANASDLTALSNKVNNATTGLEATYALADSKLDPESAANMYATKQQLADAQLGGSEVDLSGYLTTAEAAEIYALKTSLSDKADASDVNALANKVNDTTTGLDTKLSAATAAETYALKSALSDKANASDLTTLSNKVNDAETGLDTKLSATTAAETFALKTALSDKANASDLTALSNKVNDATTGLDTKLSAAAAAETYATKSSLNGLATEEYVTQEIGKIDIPETDLSDYYNQSEVNTLLATKAAASDVNALTGRVGTAEGNITTLQSALDSKASASALTTLSNKVNNATTGLDSKASASALTTLSNKVNDATTGLDTKASAGSVYTKTEVDNTLATYATKSYVDSQAPNVELDYNSDTNSLVYRNSPTDTWRSIPISGLKGEDGVTPLLEANDARQAIRVSYDNGQTYTTLVPYETIKGPKGDKGDPGCDDFEVQTEETENGSRVSVICVQND